MTIDELIEYIENDLDENGLMVVDLNQLRERIENTAGSEILFDWHDCHEGNGECGHI